MSPRGGPRNGQVGKNYPNRTDLNPAAPKPLAPTAAAGQPYGVAGAQLASQKIVPMANGPLPSAPIQSAPSGPPALTGPAPGSLSDLFGPTQRPDEHFMTGVNAGPGAGSEALAPSLPPAPVSSALALLNSLEVVSPAVKAVRDQLALQAQNQMPH